MQKKSPRLLFTDEEREQLDKAARKADKAADRLDKAEARVRKKKVIKKQRYTDKNGKAKTKIRFEEVDKKKPSSNLKSEIKRVPTDITVGTAVKVLHENEDDSAASDAMHGMEKTAELSMRAAKFAARSSKLKPYKELEKAEKQADKANIQALNKQVRYQQGSNPQSKWQQKQAIKKEYAKVKRSGQATKNASDITNAAAQKAAKATQKTAEFIAKNKKALLIIGLAAVIIAVICGVFSSCSVMLEGVGSAVSSTTYPSADSEMLAAEERYKALEQELSDKISNFEDENSYDEYAYELDDIEHDPYVLISILSVLHPGAWTFADVEADIQMLFDKQYTFTSVAETNTETGTTKCTVTLVNNNLSHIPSDIMTEEQLQLYATYMKTLGNRPDLFSDSVYVDRYVNTDYEDYVIPPDAMSDVKFAAMITEAKKYLGYPYVWGGSSPATSFDCSGFVCWVVNHSGWSVGRTTAEGLRQQCVKVTPANAKPGDLIFFEKTYNTASASHVGIYVGNGKMIHCGDPIQYANINSAYFSSHFMQFGRLR